MTKPRPNKKNLSPRDFKALVPEERVNMAIEMTDAVGTIALESIRDRDPRISERRLLQVARKRFQSGRRTR